MRIMTHEKTCHQINEMISGYVDNELTQQESQYVALHIENCEKCTATLVEINQLKTAIKGSDMPEMDADRIDAIMQDPISTSIQTVAWSLFLIGASILLVLVTLEFLSSSHISTTDKVLSSLLWGGLLGVFASVIRQQWMARKTDKYKGVKL
jgi:RsiW-degrading membrane proteinase PrsW (M82 family)